MSGKFELYKNKAGEFRFRMKAGNGENIGASEGYKTKAAALKGIDSVRANAGEEKHFVLKEGKGDKVYFNLKAKNHQVILSSQGYSSESAAKNGVKSVMKNGPNATLLEV